MEEAGETKEEGGEIIEEGGETIEEERQVKETMEGGGTMEGGETSEGGGTIDGGEIMAMVKRSDRGRLQLIRCKQEWRAVTRGMMRDGEDGRGWKV